MSLSDGILVITSDEHSGFWGYCIVLVFLHFVVVLWGFFLRENTFFNRISQLYEMRYIYIFIIKDGLAFFAVWNFEGLYF